MSGDVTLLDAGDGSIARLVHTASRLFEQPGFAPAALVGGLAVTIRLATVHRATNDVDTVSDGEEPRRLALEYLGDDGEGSQRIEIDGVKVDVMATAPLPSDDADLPDGDLDRLFVLGHRWALESATSVRVGVDPSPSAPTALVVASAPALVACKLHALADRRDARADKRESDVTDIVRLLGVLVSDRDAVGDFVAAPFDLAELVCRQVDEWLIRGSTRAARLMQLGAGAAGGTMEPDEIATRGSLFVDLVREAGQSEAGTP